MSPRSASRSNSFLSMLKDGLHLLWRIIFRNIFVKVFSLVFAAGLWLMVNAGERDTEKSLTVPLEWRNLPPHLVVTGVQVASVDVQVLGPRTLLGLLNQPKIVLDLTGMRPGQSSFRIGAERLSLPRGVQLVRISPSQINLDITRIETRTLPIHLDVQGEPPSGYQAGEMELVPDTVEVTGPAPAVARLRSVLTEPLQLSRLTQSTTLDLDLIRPQDDLLAYNLPQVRVRVEIQDVMISRAFPQITLTVRNTDLVAALSPTTVDVVVHGPQRVLEQLQLSEEEVFIDAAGHKSGTAPATITVLVPPGVEIVSQEPMEVSLTLTNGQVARPGEDNQDAEEEPTGVGGQ